MIQDTHQELEQLGIGRTIRTLREKKGLSRDELANIVKITPVLMSQIEDEVVPPTLATLLNLSKILDVRIDYFFKKETSMVKLELTRTNERLIVPKSRETDAARLTYKYQALSYRLKDKKMEPFLIEFNTETEENLAPLSHDGEEFLYCLDGEIEFISAEGNITLQPGDSLYFYSSLPHALRGIGPGKPKAIAVLLPGEENS